MKLLHFWIVLLSLVSGLVGFAAGELNDPDPSLANRGRFAAYSDRLTAEFGLSVEREAALRVVLVRYERELEDLKSRLLSTLEPELVQLGDTYRDLIRDKVLPEDQRRAFDELVASSLSFQDN
ncbi:MAG: hypothetical protein ACI9D0_001165 [Bacteroidia bacterium]|jgi:hypothetical protein